MPSRRSLTPARSGERYELGAWSNYAPLDLCRHSPTHHGLAVGAAAYARSSPEPASEPGFDMYSEAMSLATATRCRLSCMHARGPEVTDDCRQQADFIKRFRDCDSECRDLAVRFAQTPSR